MVTPEGKGISVGLVNLEDRDDIRDGRHNPEEESEGNGIQNGGKQERSHYSNSGKRSTSNVTHEFSILGECDMINYVPRCRSTSPTILERE